MTRRHCSDRAGWPGRSPGWPGRSPPLSRRRNRGQRSGGIFRIEVIRLIIALNCTVEHASHRSLRQPRTKNSVPRSNTRVFAVRAIVACARVASFLRPVSPHACNCGANCERKEKHCGSALELLASVVSIAGGPFGLVARGNEIALGVRQPVAADAGQRGEFRPLGAGGEMLRPSRPSGSPSMSPVHQPVEHAHVRGGLLQRVLQPRPLRDQSLVGDLDGPSRWRGAVGRSPPWRTFRPASRRRVEIGRISGAARRPAGLAEPHQPDEQRSEELSLAHVEALGADASAS